MNLNHSLSVPPCEVFRVTSDIGVTPNDKVALLPDNFTGLLQAEMLNYQLKGGFNHYKTNSLARN